MLFLLQLNLLRILKWDGVLKTSNDLQRINNLMRINKNDKEPISTDILRNKNYAEPSVFQPANLLRESRRQNGIPLGEVSRTCIPDPDGNLVDYPKI